MHILIKDKYLLYNDYKVKCSIGKRGINIKKKEGDLITLQLNEGVVYKGQIENEDSIDKYKHV